MVLFIEATGKACNISIYYPQALDYHQQSLAISRELGDQRGESISLSNIGNIYSTLSQYVQALDYYQQALTLSRELGDRRGESITLNNIGLVYDNLGDYEQALAYYQQSLPVFAEIGDRRGESITLGNIGLTYNYLEQYENALDYHQQALSVFVEIGDRRSESITLNNLGLTYYELDQASQSLEYYQQAIAISREIGDRTGLGRNLGSAGRVYGELGDYSAALESLQNALSIQREIGDRVGEARTLIHFGTVLDAMAEPELAIVFLKQSINHWEALRTEIRTLDREQQQTLTDRVSSGYRQLADLLLQADRVLEAQEVLDLLKLQELDDYQIQEVRGTPATQQGLSFWQAEQNIVDRYAEHLQIHPLPAFETFMTQSDVMAHIAQLQRSARGQNLNPEQLGELQDNLQQIGNAALLYPLILEDRLELVLVTTTGLIRHTVPITRTDLNVAIVNFRADITNRRSDPRPTAQQLYNFLIAPIAAELEQSNTDTILYAADGALRYIPLAALHDGQRWLTERYTINHITAASLTDFSPTAESRPTILAGAFPEQGMEVDLGTEQVYFEGLPYAQQEVRNLQASVPNTLAFFSDAFTRNAIEPQLNDHTILHLATHAEFRSGHPSDSFILLGDGDRITLFDLNQWKLPNVDLVVLSACKTAVSGADLGNGEEILGFGYQVQRTGARAAIASLWYVNDGGTQVLMNAFYSVLTQGMTKTEALQQAQIALITGDLSSVGDPRGDGTIELLSAETGLTSAVSNNLNHPYYWAPFILIGNGL